MISRKIEFEKLLNTRDLGGMTGADGRKIKPGKLFRSGHFYGASEADLKKLTELIEVSVDFRSNQECEEKPEISLPGVLYYHLPVIAQSAAGVTRDEDSFAEVRAKMLFDADVAKKYMMRTYTGFILDDHSHKQYEQFIHLLLTDRDKGVLWHCTAGKDRAGFGTVIVQELLGVSREDIEADYLFTNICLEPDIRRLTDLLSHQPGVEPEIAAQAVSYVFAAKPDYLRTAYDCIEANYGCFENFCREALRVTDEERTTLRNLYLE